jgi:hypothetical protein
VSFFWLTGLLCYVNAKQLSRFFLNPLRRIPGPLVAAITSNYIALFNLRGNRIKLIHRLHQQYGPVVRIAPNEVSFSDKSVISQLYCQGTEFMKAARYHNFAIPPETIFVMRNKTQASERRRYLGSVFSWRYLQTIEPVIERHLLLLTNVIDHFLGKPLPTLYWFRLLALDIIGLSPPFSPTYI